MKQRNPSSTPPLDPKKTALWYALYTRSRFEKKVAKQLEEREIEHFLPLLPRLRQWKDRKKVVEMPMFPGYLFVHIKLIDKVRALEVDGAVRLVGFGGEPVPIPREQIESVQGLLAEPKLLEPHPYVSAGDWVTITHGPLTGVKGKLIQIRSQQRLLVGIDIIQQAVSVEVDMRWVKPLKKDK